VKSSNVPVFYQGAFFARKGNKTPSLSPEETFEYIEAHFKRTKQSLNKIQLESKALQGVTDDQ
jgi:hypothetical protein